MSVKEDSGSSSSVSSSPQAPLSPQLDVLQSFMENGKLMENMLGSHMQQAAYQQAMQVELLGQMQLMGFMNMAPVAPNIPPSAEMQRLLMETFSENYNANMMAQQQLMLQQMMLMNNGGSGDTQMQLDPRILNKVREDTPLDLSGKKDMGVSGLSLFNGFDCLKKNDDSGDDKGGKRNYSQVDLNAAVNDIRNGKLGTRRASVVYGIPRSTLRNKIYKLEGVEAFNKRKKPNHIHSELIIKNTADQEMSDKLIANSHSDSNSPSDESVATERPTSLSETNEEKQTSSCMPGSVEISKLWNQNDIWSVFNAAQGNTVSEVLTQPRSRKSKNSDPDRKMRPKRGQYRKYDKSSLDQAVQSVRSGEMSVHRAGSYYGVPHSTLEYKVKERNLMRKKKLEDEANSSISEENEKTPDPECSSSQTDGPLSSLLESAPEMSPELALGNLLEQFSKIQNGIPNLFDVIST